MLPTDFSPIRSQIHFGTSSERVGVAEEAMAELIAGKSDIFSTEAKGKNGPVDLANTIERVLKAVQIRRESDPNDGTVMTTLVNILRNVANHLGLGQTTNNSEIFAKAAEARDKVGGSLKAYGDVIAQKLGFVNQP